MNTGNIAILVLENAFFSSKPGRSAEDGGAGAVPGRWTCFVIASAS